MCFVEWVLCRLGLCAVAQVRRAAVADADDDGDEPPDL